MPPPKLSGLLQQLIALPSISCTNPALDQGNRNVINTLANWLEDLGFKHEGLDNLKNAREELAGQVDPSLRSWYKRLTAKFGHAVVPVVGNLCTGCFANIPSSFVSKTNINKVQKCESCGRLLYWP